MQATIVRVKQEEIKVEIPDQCPKCGADFKNKEENFLKEDQWVGHEQTGRIGDEGMEHDGSDEVCCELVIVIGYRCGQCDHILVSTETDVEEANAIQEKTA